jgi:hypothetical protein
MEDDVTFCGDATERRELSRVRIVSGRAEEEAERGPLLLRNESLRPEVCLSCEGILGKYSPPMVGGAGGLGALALMPCGVGDVGLRAVRRPRRSSSYRTCARYKRYGSGTCKWFESPFPKEIMSQPHSDHGQSEATNSPSENLPPVETLR